MIKTSDDKILILISHYLPGYKIGGPLNSVLSITKNLEDYYNFFIITSDRDMGDEKSYINIEKNKWLKTDSAVAMYFSPGISYYWNIYKHLRKNSYNIVYLNSLFEWKFSIFIILLNYFRLFKTNKIIVAPRGELFDEAIKFGKFKKQAFLRIANFLGLYNRVIWHSTAEIETLTINNNIPNPEIRLARTLSNTTCTLFEIKEPEFSLKQGVSLKVIFLSRISKEKNLIYALRVLKEVSCFVEFHIYGPIEDRKIWNECLAELKLLPKNVVVQYKGEVENKFVKTYFSKYDLFLFPTHLENYGHVISESLSVGTPVMLSDNTPWRSLNKKGLGWDFSLKNREYFIDSINSYAKKTLHEKLIFRAGVIKSYLENENEHDLVKENYNLFKNI